MRRIIAINRSDAALTLTVHVLLDFAVTKSYLFVCKNTQIAKHLQIRPVDYLEALLPPAVFASNVQWHECDQQ